MGILEDIWNAISSPPGSTTPILAPDTIRSPEEVLEEEIIPSIVTPGFIPETIVEDISGEDIENPVATFAGKLTDFGFKDPTQRIPWLTIGAGLGIGYILLRD